MNRKQFMNTHVDDYSFSETIQKMEEMIINRSIAQHVAINANKINMMYKSKELKNIVDNSELISADGQSIVWASKILGNDIKERVTGIDLFETLVCRSEKKGFRVYYLGAEEEVLNRVLSIHKKQYPHLQIAGSQHGYFDRNKSIEVADRIRDSQADILFVAFSSPEKELWINKYKNYMKIPLVVGVGGSFDVVSGKISRAPKWMQKSGLEWLYRFINEPIRLFNRYIVGNTVFVFHVFKEKSNKKRRLDGK
ncbi:glycosyltransferase [Enterococcus faecalis]|uniref:WecB/TagA/CpsF family glycosyltransferase n=1 Tax=Enterococcus faecalis TaxID=1351 RepID=UPI001363B864|nr:WecB/TagA/CpsF family glycosyltransferase [Enterococcus faecalis]NBJ47418.1 glycosyltransferase [Enterococcus faecalis]